MGSDGEGISPQAVNASDLAVYSPKVALAIKKCSTVMHGERRPHIMLLDIVLQKTFQRI